MRVAVLDDIHHAYDRTSGIRRLRERTRFTRELLEQLPDVRIIAQTGNHAHHIDLAAAHERGIVVARPQPDTRLARRSSPLGSRLRSCAAYRRMTRRSSEANGPRRPRRCCTARRSASSVSAGSVSMSLREADVVSIHASLTKESRGLLDARRIGLMKPTAYLVNTARGPIIDEAA